MDRPFLLYACSEHSQDIFPNNTPPNFAIHLKRPVHLEGQWECALVQFVFDGKPEAGYFVCCDLVRESHTGDYMLPVLRQVRDKMWQFKNLLYVPLKSRDFNAIRIYLRTWKNGEPTRVKNTVYCTLHFRRIG